MSSINRAFQTLKQDGFLVTAVAFPDDADRQRGIGIGRVQCQPNAEQLACIRELVEGGKLTARVAAVFPVTEITKALDLSESGRSRGKIVLQMAL